ncbi:spermatogenesis associated 6-like protein isoform X5 [Trachinotus anak]|uniref:spermatogenesis associated 6-like protein isoform X5 n=1 Tax=Trachinotus anak TaxID=443729 RepID=UPI0039F20E26
MPRKALKVVVEFKFRAVSCPGVHLPAKDDIYLSMCFMGQYRQSECLPAVFPLLFHEKMTFEKIFRHAVDPGDIAVMLEYETIRIELVQLVPPVGDTLACFEEDARRFLFPEPKLVPSFSGVDREILMTRAPYFPGIAPRLEFSTKTTIIECSADAEINIYPNVLLRPVIKRSSRPRTSSPQRKQPQTLVRRRGGRMDRGRRSAARSQSLSPLRAGNTQRLGRLSLSSAAPIPADTDTASSSQPMMASWPGASRSDSHHRSAVFTSSSSPLIRSSSTDSLQVEEEDLYPMVWLEGNLRTTQAPQKHMILLTTIVVLTLQHCGGLIKNKRGSAVFTENGKKSMSVFEDSLRRQKLCADLSTGPQSLR